MVCEKVEEVLFLTRNMQKWLWRAEIGTFIWCLQYAIIKLETDLFNIMVTISQALALSIIFQYVVKINRAFHFLNIIFVFGLLLIVLIFTVSY